ncbi:MAG TPA: sigma-70 family RNA polymerase sigma factor [Holophaga sp.]|nr:sigma-70 family RNA polymerase sigma factor [Holophaga sp.]
MEPSTAEILPVSVKVNGKAYLWTAASGLDPAVVGELEPWIRKRAFGFSGAARMRGLDLEDLCQEGRAGALRAAMRFLPSAGSTYFHYADAWIRQSMILALNQSHCVHMPTRARNQALKSGTLPDVLRLDAPVPDADISLLDLQSSDLPTPLDVAQQSESSLKLRAAMRHLSAAHRTILARRYGLDGQEAESLEAIALSLGWSHERVRRQQLRAEAQLRTLLRETPMEPIKPAPRAPKPPQGRQITVQEVIRDQKRQERAAVQARKDRQKAAREAQRGTPLFDEEY